MINLEGIKNWWRVFVGDGNMVEVRILGKFQYSGYFKSVENLIKEITPYAGMDNEQVYFTLNEINPDCYGRQQCEKIVKSPKTTTTDTDIVSRKTVLIDFDPVRATGVNSSDEEFELAHKKAQVVFRYLREQGFSEPVIAVSGNGWHLQYFLDSIPNTEGNTETIKRFLQSLSKMFSDDKVDIDEKVFNAGRICKLYGTMAKKGANIAERPWRMSRLVYVPSQIQTSDFALFQKIADLLPKEAPKVAPNKTYRQQFDLRTWLNEHGIAYKEKTGGNGTMFTLEKCPWIDQHSDHKSWDSALFQDADGKITFNCQHSHCKGKTWHDVRLFYEPDAYDKPAYLPQQFSQQRQYPQRQRYEIKHEIPELGKKWLTMSSIKKVDLSKIDGFKTGFVELDKGIVKLHYGEVTVISGSNASGKSSWLNTLIMNVANQKVPTALWSGELQEQILKTWIQMVAAGKRNLRVSQFGDGKYYVPSNIGQRIDEWLDDKLFIYNTEYGNQWEQLLSDMDVMYKAGVKLFVLDNLMAMNIDLLEGDKNNKQKTVILKVKEFAKKKNVHIVLVAHPRKSMAFLRKNDISGTSDLTNVVDNIFIMHRVNNDFLRTGEEYFGKGQMKRFEGYGNVLEVCKNRMYGIVDLFVGMHYEVESRRFKNAPDEDIQYGWEQEPIQGAMAFDNAQGGQVYQPAQETRLESPQTVYTDTMDSDMPFGMPTDDSPF